MHQEVPDGRPPPPGAAGARGAPRWLKVAAVAAATASALALVVVDHGDPYGHGPGRAHVELSTVAHAAAGTMAGHPGLLEGVRGRMAGRHGAIMAAQHEVLADALGVDAADLEEAIEEGIGDLGLDGHRGRRGPVGRASEDLLTADDAT